MKRNVMFLKQEKRGGFSGMFRRTPKNPEQQVQTVWSALIRIWSFKLYNLIVDLVLGVKTKELEKPKHDNEAWM